MGSGYSSLIDNWAGPLRGTRVFRFAESAQTATTADLPVPELEPVWDARSLYFNDGLGRPD